MLDAIAKEIKMQSDYLESEVIDTIYFGGGTPSILDTEEINTILNLIRATYEWGKQPEITLEANPDDLSAEKIDALAKTPINRLSIGIQSFFNEDLQFMNRAHNAEEATQCIQLSQQAGFHDISIDLIYGAPTTSHDMWKRNLEKAFSFGIPHISSYCLTVEPQTALHHFVKSGRAQPVDEAKAEEQFHMLVQSAKDHGYEHYEISNFAQPQRYSKHNTAYWQGKKYLGIGPSAHSFNGISRQWNISNNATYLKNINDDQPHFEVEELSDQDRYNEYVMTSLRTQWGCRIDSISEPFREYFLKRIQNHIQNGQIIKKEDAYIIAPSSRFLSDGIAADLFYVNNQ